MTVSLAGSLPKDDLNGLAAAERRLMKERHDGNRYLFVGVLETTGAKEKAPDWKLEPTVSLTHVELVLGDLSDEVARILVRLYQERTGRVGLDFPGAESEPETLAITSEAGAKFRVSQDDEGVFSIELMNAHGDVIGSRGSLRGDEFADLDFAVGAFAFEQLPIVLQSYARTLLAEWGVDADEPDDVVDAEVLEDDE